MKTTKSTRRASSRVVQTCLRAISVAAATALLAVGGLAIGRAADGDARGLDLEDAVDRSDLVVAVRVADVGRREMIHGGKVVSSTQQFTFQPIKRLKGVFARDSLLLTSDDLGTDRFDDRQGRIERGQTRLLILARSPQGFANCNLLGRLDLSLPRVANDQDPLLGAVEVLIAVGPERDRARRAALLVDGLKAAQGEAAIPLLLAIERRALLASQTTGAATAAARGLTDPDAAVREVSARVLSSILRADSLNQKPIRAEALTACLPAADARLGPPLVAMLDQMRVDLRSSAIDALLKIDTNASAAALKPLLTGEGDLRRKLWMAEFLGRHGIRDGYPYAIEHLSEPGLLEDAVAALAAIKEPKAVEELGQILKTSRDVDWNRAAVRGLGRLGRREYAAEFLAWAADRRQPLAGPALIALADLGDVRATPIIREALTSRNDATVLAAARAAATLLKVNNNNVDGDAVRDRLAALLADPEATPESRIAALDALVALNDARLDRALVTAVRDVSLERSNLLERIESVIKERGLAIPPR